MFFFHTSFAHFSQHKNIPPIHSSFLCAFSFLFPFTISFSPLWMSRQPHGHVHQFWQPFFVRQYRPKYSLQFIFGNSRIHSSIQIVPKINQLFILSQPPKKCNFYPIFLISDTSSPVIFPNPIWLLHFPTCPNVLNKKKVTPLCWWFWEGRWTALIHHGAKGGFTFVWLADWPPFLSEHFGQ